MNAPSVKYQKIISIFLLFAVFLIVYSKVFDKKISPVGDNVHYYLLGQALANGAGYTNTFAIKDSPHQHFPPGYPAIISVVQIVFPDNIMAIKILNGFLFFLCIALLFIIILKLQYSILFAFIVSVFLLLNQHLLGYSFMMMSEIPFLFFTLLGLISLINLNPNRDFVLSSSFWLLVVFASFSLYIRSVGIVLIASVFIYFISKKQYKYSALFAFAAFALQLPWQIRNIKLGGHSYVHQLMLKNPYQPELGNISLQDLFERIIINSERYITREIPQSLFNFMEVHNMKNPVLWTEWLWGFLILFFIVLGLIKLKKFRCFFIVYTALYFLVLILWPYQWYGPRFVLPIVPFLMLFFVNGFIEFIQLALKFFSKKQISEKLHLTAGLTLVVIFVYVSIHPIKILSTKARLPYEKTFQSLINQAIWMKNNSKQSAVCICENQSYFYLFSGRKTFAFKDALNSPELLEGHDIYFLIDRFINTETKQRFQLSLKENKKSSLLVNQDGVNSSLLFKISREEGK